ncbi:MAG: CoA-binding protein [Candidatus Helarchaeota archaeon]
MSNKLLSKDEFKEFDAFFNPRSVAIIGASKKRGFWWINSLVQANFKGKIFPIHRNYQSYLGITFYKSLLDVPASEPIDYCIISIPKKYVLQALNECFQKKVKLVTIFTSGFSETGRKEDIELENKIKKMIADNDYKTRVIGPNCMGLYVPSKLHFNYNMPRVKGPIAFLSQSGGLAQNVSYKLGTFGAGLSKVVSFGNQVDLDVTDFLEYLADDRSTKFIGMYLEGLKKEKSRKFFDILRATTRKKPVMLWQGGQTEEGARAAATHTGAIKGSLGSQKIWNAIRKQTGLMMAHKFDDLINTIMMFNCYNYKKHKDLSGNVCVMSISGGVSVVYTDILSKNGLKVPKLHPDTIERLSQSFNYQVGNSMNNPVDLASDFFNFGGLQEIFKSVEEDKNTDCILFELNIQYTRVEDPYYIERNQWMKFFYKRIKAALINIKKSGKPVILIIPVITFLHKLIDDWSYFQPDFPIYMDIESAAKAIKQFVDYKDFYFR